MTAIHSSTPIADLHREQLRLEIEDLQKQIDTLRSEVTEKEREIAGMEARLHEATALRAAFPKGSP